jgi:hypothetical protein
MDEVKVPEPSKDESVVDALKELTKANMDVIKELKGLKEVIEKHFKAGRF